MDGSGSIDDIIDEESQEDQVVDGDNAGNISKSRGAMRKVTVSDKFKGDAFRSGQIQDDDDVGAGVSNWNSGTSSTNNQEKLNEQRRGGKNEGFRKK
jgi:hypothetical protein